MPLTIERIKTEFGTLEQRIKSAWAFPQLKLLIAEVAEIEATLVWLERAQEPRIAAAELRKLLENRMLEAVEQLHAGASQELALPVVVRITTATLTCAKCRKSNVDVQFAHVPGRASAAQCRCTGCEYVWVEHLGEHPAILLHQRFLAAQKSARSKRIIAAKRATREQEKARIEQKGA